MVNTCKYFASGILVSYSVLYGKDHSTINARSEVCKARILHQNYTSLHDGYVFHPVIRKMAFSSQAYGTFAIFSAYTGHEIVVRRLRKALLTFKYGYRRKLQVKKHRLQSC